MVDTPFSNRLKDIREQRRLSQRQLAARCSIAEKQIWRYENGASEPSAGHLVKIARELGVSADYLLGLVDKPNELYSGEELDVLQQEIVSLIRRNDLLATLEAIQILSTVAYEMEDRARGLDLNRLADEWTAEAGME